MRKVREILRLHYEGKLRQREIARAANVSQSTVSTCISRAIRAQLSWPPPADWDEDRLLRPKSHQAHLKWTPSRIIEWAGKTGPHTARLVECVLASKPHPEMGYRTCLGFIRLAEQNTAPRMEAAAERALLTGAIALRR